jgi:23S rRNA G2445 N2-methylase RlmL
VVALRAVQWFEELGVRTVVDIGSGAGKFCVAAALAGRCRFIGVEQRPRLVEAARELARRFRVDDRVHFSQGAFGDVALPEADAFYLFNPFGENLYGSGSHIDETVELTEERYVRDVFTTEVFLEHARVGTLVVTYNGFGGMLPDTYRKVRVDRELPNVLRMSRKIR